MSLDLFKKILKKLKAYGAKAITISGGGEPLLNQHFERMMEYAVEQGIAVGLVTNGIAFKNWPVRLYSALDWIRVSFDGHRRELPDIYESVKTAYSYVYDGTACNADPNLMELVRRARQGKIDHLRIVSDILHPTVGPTLRIFKETNLDPLPDNVIVQNRHHRHRGTRRCWIALMKPVVNVDGLIWPCCGAQYALEEEENRAHLPGSMCMGTVDNLLDDFVVPQRPYNGMACVKCYYGDVNTILDKIKRVKYLQYTDFV